MTAALEGSEWSAARRGHTLAPEKTQYPFYRRVSGPQGRSGRAENLVPTGIRSRTIQPVVIPYTDWATFLFLLFIDINSMPHYIAILHALYNLSFSFTITFTFNNHKTTVEICYNFNKNIFDV